jgi:hypothetical protein
MPEFEFMNISLDCLQKIVLCRMTYIDKETVSLFERIVITGMNRIMVNPALTEKVLFKVLDANIKMLNNIDLYQFRKYEPELTNWIKNVRNICNSVSSSMKLSNENLIYKMSFELVSKIITNSVSPKLEEYKKDFHCFARVILEVFLNNFFSKDQSVMG